MSNVIAWDDGIRDRISVVYFATSRFFGLIIIDVYFVIWCESCKMYIFPLCELNAIFTYICNLYVVCSLFVYVHTDEKINKILFINLFVLNVTAWHWSHTFYHSKFLIDLVRWPLLIVCTYVDHTVRSLLSEIQKW